jgi:thiosulfate dehydrogenase [quinone] large subunit
MSELMNKQKIANSIVLLRVFIGWHFLYEGVIKMYNPDWTSIGYLASAQGPLRSFFFELTNDSILGIVDFLNIAALMVVGITLILGIFEKIGAMVGVGLIALYYLAHPSFPWLTQLNVEGSYWFVNKNLVELAACLVIYQFPTGQYFGLKYIINKKKNTNKTENL